MNWLILVNTGLYRLTKVMVTCRVRAAVQAPFLHVFELFWIDNRLKGTIMVNNASNGRK